MEPLKTHLTPRGVSCIASGCGAHRRHPPMIPGALLLVLLATGAAVRAQECPPETFNYGPPCDLEAEDIVLDHYGADGPLLPDPKDCARAARDLGLIRAAFPSFVGLTHAPDCSYPNSMVLKTFTPSDPDLVCLNLYYQVSFDYFGFGDWWVVTFPRSVNGPAMAEIYLALPTVLSASFGGGCAYIDCPVSVTWSYAPLPNGAWHWNFTAEYDAGRGGCRTTTSNFYVTEAGRVFPLSQVLPGQFEPAPDDASVEATLDVNEGGFATAADRSIVVGAWKGTEDCAL